jgi:hypothetical protein
MDERGIMALAQLICNMNPYTGVTDLETRNTTQKMVVGPAQRDNRNGDEVRPLPDQLTASIAKRIPNITVEVERNYGTTWSFKGQTQTIKSALRLPYTFDVKDANGQVICRQTEYLLIGYAGAGGGT